MFPSLYETGEHRTLFQKKGSMFTGLLIFPSLLPNSSRGNYHGMSLPFVEEGETLEDLKQYVHNIIMTTEEAVNEVLNRKRFIRWAYLINRWNTQDRKHSNAGKQTPRSPIPMRAPRATAIRRRTELLALILCIQILYYI